MSGDSPDCRRLGTLTAQSGPRGPAGVLPSGPRGPLCAKSRVVESFVQTTITDIAKSIDLAKTRIRKADKRITVFGGPMSNSDGPPSQRLSFLTTLSLVRSTHTKHVITPENYKDWNHFGIYNDLLQFEEDLCTLVDVIVIFLETEGAIAEFASFLKAPSALKKIIIGITEAYSDHDSFINLGLVRHLRAHVQPNDTDPDPVFTISKQIDPEDSKFISEEIDRRLDLLRGNEAFDKNNVRHIMLLVADFIELIQVARKNDILTFFEHLEIGVNSQRLQQMLFVLQRLEIIALHKASNDSFYRLYAKEEKFIDYGFKKDSIPRERIKAKFFEKTFAEPRRKLAFKKLSMAAGVENGT
ncbi:retron St85 family effector protein [Burkholderia stagnalis]|uniref:retron St85 family effector protein n=1 Tax=Burkholderia stagnalis TaxID=1503054 RepID=UPI000F561376|nr:retron St85 family effector protein [Burkholderia stagnalis]